MIKSTASAGPVESISSSPTAYYLWEFPQKPVSVRLSLDVVDRLERDVLESFRAITARGSEVGGLLLGRTESGSSLRTIVDNYELFSCDYTRGPLYLLSDEETARLDEAIRRRPAGAVVGFFRSNTRKDLAMDDEDLDLFGKYFARPEQIFLLVKPYAAKASSGGIFIWEGSTVRGEGSYIEFPFRRAELSKGEFAKSIVTDRPKSKETPTVEPHVPLPNAPKPGVRAPVLPFSLKRDEESPVAAPPLRREERAPVVTLNPKPEEEPAPVPAARKTAEPAPERKQPEPPASRPSAPKPASPLVSARSQAKEEKQEAQSTRIFDPVVRSEAKTEAKAEAKTDTRAEKKEEKKENAAAVAPASAPAALKPETIPASSLFSGKKVYALFGGILMLALAGGTTYYLKTHSVAPGTATAIGSSALDLKAELSNGQVLVTWNKDAQPIRSAQHGVLSITDGAQKEDVPLDLTQIHGGSIVYSPDPKGTGEINFRLEVNDGNPANSRSESVHVMPGTVPPPADPSNGSKPAAQLAQKATVTEAQRTAPEIKSATPEPDPPATQPQPVAQPTPPPKPFSLAARVRTAEPSDLPDAPSVNDGATGVKPVVPATATQIAPPPPPKPTPAPAPVQQPVVSAPSQPPAKIGGKVTEPKLLRKMDPIYPPMARQARVAGVVRMQATIGKDGKIRKVEVLSGPPLLRQAAIDAVQKWIYSPSLLNGAPIDATTDVELNFNLNSR